MTTEIIDKLKEVMAPIALKIGEGAEYGWEIVVRQQVAEGLVSLVHAGICLVIVVVGLTMFYKLRKLIIEETGGMAFMTAILLVIPLLVFIDEIGSGILHLTNPEYYAIEFFMNLVK